MKSLRILQRSIRDAFKSVFRNFSLSLASISCITITLVIVALSILATLNVNNFADVLKKDVTMYVFLDNDAKETEVNAIREKLDAMENIESIEFKSKEAAKKEMMAQNETIKHTMENWDEKDNPLKDSFLINVKKLEDMKTTADEIRTIDKVAIVKYGEETVTQLVKMFNAIRQVTFGIVIALIIVTVFLIVNTIKLTIFSRKREISIMRLVGASNFTIKNPFVIEGMILGAIGSIIPILIVTYGYIAFYRYCKGTLFSPLFQLIKPNPFIYYVSGTVLLIGIVVGMIGSYRAVQKYLKV